MAAGDAHEVRWKEGFDPNEVARRLEDIRKIDESGQVQFAGFRYTRYNVLVYGMLEFPESIPENDRRQIVRGAIHSVAAKGTIEPRKLLTSVNRRAREFLARPVDRYVLVTSLSLSKAVKLRKTSETKTLIFFEPSLDERFRDGAAKAMEWEKDPVLGHIPTSYTSVRVHVSARSVYEAAETALDALDLVRGVWNWFFNRRERSRLSFGASSAVNRPVLGPRHTLHFLSGRLAKQGWWYEPGYFGATRAFRPNASQIEGMLEFRKLVRRELARCRYRESLEAGVIGYVRALDTQDLHGAFLKLWNVLGLLTNTHRKGSAEVAIKRTAFLYEDRNYVLQVLKQVRDHRHKHVHQGLRSSAIETLLYELKNFVEDLLNFHLDNRYGFDSLEEASTFLDLPTENEALESRIRLARFAQRFREYD